MESALSRYLVISLFFFPSLGGCELVDLLTPDEEPVGTVTETTVTTPSTDWGSSDPTPYETGFGGYDTGARGEQAWEPADFLVYASFGVTEGGAVSPVQFPNYGATYPDGLPPAFEFYVVGSGYFQGHADEICEIVFQVDRADTPDPPAGSWYEWTVAPGDASVTLDTCRPVGVGYAGYDLSAFFGMFDWAFAVGPVDEYFGDMMAGYTGYDADNLLGYSLGGSLFVGLSPIGVMQALPVDASMAITGYSYLPASEVPTHPGIRSAYYRAVPVAMFAF